MNEVLQSLTSLGFWRYGTLGYLLFYPRKEILNQRLDGLLPFLKTFLWGESFQLCISIIEFSDLLQCHIRNGIPDSRGIIFIHCLYCIRKITSGVRPAVRIRHSWQLFIYQMVLL